MSENAVNTSIIEYLWRTGWLVIRVNSGAFAGEYTNRKGETKKRFLRFVTWYVLGDDPQTSGHTDIIAFHPAFPPLACEAKVPGKENNVSQAQLKFIDEWRRHGGIAIVASSIDDVVNTLAQVQTPGR